MGSDRYYERRDYGIPKLKQPSKNINGASRNGEGREVQRHVSYICVCVNHSTKAIRNEQEEHTLTCILGLEQKTKKRSI